MVGLDVKDVPDVQKEPEDVEECFEETFFVLAIVDVDEVV